MNRRSYFKLNQHFTNKTYIIEYTIMLLELNCDIDYQKYKSCKLLRIVFSSVMRAANCITSIH